MNLDHLLPKTPQPPKGLVYSYIDGSGNVYYITKNLLQYDPMDARYSSSGLYDGGKAAKVVLDLEQFEAIEKIMQEVQQNDSDHLSNRVKGSGKLDLHQEDQYFILNYNSNSQKSLEILLKKMMPQ
jgi:hypothetical protein